VMPWRKGAPAQERMWRNDANGEGVWVRETVVLLSDDILICFEG
jgi:hypothetical protein